MGHVRATRLAWSAFRLTAVITVGSIVVGFQDHRTCLPPPGTAEVSGPRLLTLAVALSAAQRGVVRETVQPSHVSLWLREAAR
jgi:hypothetical protein